MKQSSAAEAGFLFSERTFAYFDAARRHAKKREWFDRNRGRFEEFVEVPFTHLILQLREHLGPRLPGIDFLPRKLSKPLHRGAKEGEPQVRSNAYAMFAEKSESMFDTNPGFYIDFGAERCVVGCGLYEVSSRQMRALRPALLQQHENVRRLLADRKLRRAWDSGDGVLQGERYTRFPKAFDEGTPGAEYLWHKQWMLGRTLSRDEVCDPHFTRKLARDFEAALPFLEWTRKTVGVWKRPAPNSREWV